MNSIERFYATVDRRPVDRPASWLGIPDKHALPALYNHFGVKDMAGLKRAVGDGILNDGGEHRQFGWGRFSPALRNANGGDTFRVSPAVSGLRIHARALRVAEAAQLGSRL